MSTFRGWKEERIRHHIYLDQLKTAQNFSDGISLNGARFEGREGSSDSLLQEQPDSVRAGRTSTAKKKDGLTWMMVRLALLGAAGAVWFWIHAGQLGVHR